MIMINSLVTFRGEMSVPQRQFVALALTVPVHTTHSY